MKLEKGYVGLTVSKEARFNDLKCKVVEIDEDDEITPYRVEIIHEGYFEGMQYWVNDVITLD
jgi:hypothetical protein